MILCYLPSLVHLFYLVRRGYLRAYFLINPMAEFRAQGSWALSILPFEQRFHFLSCLYKALFGFCILVVFGSGGYQQSSTQEHEGNSQ